MFNPSREEVRQFFTSIWSKHQHQQILTPLENHALTWILQHPEYHAVLQNPDSVEADYTVENGQTNPFLHLSMHLAIQEQINIDSPKGIRDIYHQLQVKYGEHEACHKIMEALGLVIWESQRYQQPLRNERYLELLQKCL